MRIRNFIFFLLLPLLSFKIFPQKGEIKKIEALPARERAEMNIEITKINSENIQGHLDRGEKTITLDFTEILKKSEKQKIKIQEENYEIFFAEDLNSLSSYSGMGTGEGSRYSYKIEDTREKKKMKITYSKKPDSLYMGILDRRNKLLVRVFSISQFETLNSRLSGNIGNRSDFTFTETFHPLSINDSAGAATPLINVAGTLTASQNRVNEQFLRNAFPVIAVGGGWKRETNGVDSILVNPLSSDFSPNSDSSVKIPIAVYLKNPQNTGSSVFLYRQYINQEKARVYGTYSTWGGDIADEKIGTSLVMEFPPDILKIIRRINQQTFTLRSSDAEQLSYSVSTYNGSQFKVPYENNNTGDYVTRRLYPTVTVSKEIVNNNVTLEFTSGYQGGKEIFFAQDGTASESGIITETTGSHPQYFMTGAPFKGTLDITGNLSGISGIPVGEEGISGEVTLNLSRDSKTALLKLAYSNNGTVRMKLESWTGQGEFHFQIIHREESGLARRTYNIQVKTPSLFEFVSVGSLDFGTILRGDSGDEATAEIRVSGLGNSSLILVPQSETINLIKEGSSSKVTVGEFSVSPKTGNTGEEKSYNIKARILDSWSATESGEHTGNLYINAEIIPATGVKK